MHRFLSILIVFSMMIFPFYGCESMGRVAAKTEKGIETGAHKIEDSIENASDKFKDGYNDEKNKK